MLIGVVFALVAIVVGVYLIFKERGEKDIFSVIKCEKVDTLAMSNVIKFFKQSDILEKLKENKDFIAVAMKQNETDGSFKIACCIFDKAKSNILDMEHVKCFHAKMLDRDLQEAFGDKEMIILN